MYESCSINMYLVTTRPCIAAMEVLEECSKQRPVLEAERRKLEGNKVSGAIGHNYVHTM